MKTALKTLERALRCLALLACCLPGAGSQSYMNETGAEVAEAVAASVTEAPGPHAADSAGPHAVELVAGRTRYRSPTADSAPRVIHPFEKPAQRWSAGHRGVDLAVPDRDRHVYAPAPGRVVFSGTVVNRKVLVIAHPDGRRSTFEPMDEALPVGTEVTAGDAVGTVAAPESAGENGERPYRRCRGDVLSISPLPPPPPGVDDSRRQLDTAMARRLPLGDNGPQTPSWATFPVGSYALRLVVTYWSTSPSVSPN